MVQCVQGKVVFLYTGLKLQGNIQVWIWELGPDGKALFFPALNLPEKHSVSSALQQQLWSQFWNKKAASYIWLDSDLTVQFHAIRGTISMAVKAHRTLSWHFLPRIVHCALGVSFCTTLKQLVKHAFENLWIGALWWKQYFPPAASNLTEKPTASIFSYYNYSSHVFEFSLKETCCFLLFWEQVSDTTISANQGNVRYGRQHSKSILLTTFLMECYSFSRVCHYKALEKSGKHVLWTWEW